MVQVLRGQPATDARDDYMDFDHTGPGTPAERYLRSF
ncbi:MAG: hypothetical protein QOF51_1361 [Chloroflexota bacterium]|jgi:hypothetical protein|nr:hypothetical protein [Chloroflexota bacterium]